jgi:UDP-N-acetylglucosamine 2-epimerase (non-hydrolysing)
MAHLHVVAADAFRRRVMQLGEAPKHVWVVGATGLDNIARTPLLNRQALQVHLKIELRSPTFLVTYHPVTLRDEDPGHAMKTLLGVLDEHDGSIVITGVNADTGANSIQQEAERFARARPDRVALVESLGTQRYLSAISHADVVIGNSSSGLVEAPSLGVPTVDIGERQQGRLRAESVVHCAATAADIRRAVGQSLSPEHRALSARRQSPYGETGAAERIAQVLVSHPLQGLLVKRFQDLPFTEAKA